MIGVVIVAHGGLAAEYLDAVEHVLGRQPGMRAISIRAADGRAEKRGEICAAVQAVDAGDGVVMVTDMYGGTPSNLAVSACDRNDHKVIYGANLPMLIKLTKARNLPVEDAVACACAAGHKYLDTITPCDAEEKQ